MKKLLPIFIALLLASCGGSKKVIQDQPLQVAKVEAKEMTKTQDSTVQDSEEAVKEVEKVKEVAISKSDSAIYVRGGKFITNHSSFDALLQKYVSAEGQVDYKGFKIETSALRAYIASLSENLPDDTWSKEDKLAYWINAYNAMTIDLIIRNYPVASIKDIKDPWKQRFWKLGDKWYNLDEIEHQIIRKMGEPRIHFALVCAAVSCPKLYNKAFTASSLEEDLAKLTREFLSDSSKNTLTEDSIELSKIFSWFAKDFKQDGSLVEFLNKYSDIEISENAKKRFKKYNWALNE